MDNYCSALICAFVADIIIGDPVYIFHPTRLIGKLIHLLEQIFEKSGMFNVAGGCVFTVATLFTVALFYISIRYLITKVSTFLGFVFDVFILYSAIALRDMTHHANIVHRELKKKNLDEAKIKLSAIVGRDTKKLDESGIVAATIESMSENFVDGFFAVIFWGVIGIMLGYFTNSNRLFLLVLFAVLYRTVNTLDSTVGYKNARYLFFGKCSAKTDDMANFIPARLSVFSICLGACFLGYDCISCLKTAKKDRLKHPSPNSAHPESAVSGALHIKLGGNIKYPHTTIEKPFIGNSYEFPRLNHIKQCSILLYAAAVISLIIYEIFCLLIF